MSNVKIKICLLNFNFCILSRGGSKTVRFCNKPFLDSQICLNQAHKKVRGIAQKTLNLKELKDFEITKEVFLKEI